MYLSKNKFSDYLFPVIPRRRPPSNFNFYSWVASWVAPRKFNFFSCPAVTHEYSHSLISPLPHPLLAEASGIFLSDIKTSFRTSFWKVFSQSLSSRSCHNTLRKFDMSEPFQKRTTVSHSNGQESRASQPSQSYVTNNMQTVFRVAAHISGFKIANPIYPRLSAAPQVPEMDPWSCVRLWIYRPHLLLLGILASCLNHRLKVHSRQTTHWRTITCLHMQMLLLQPSVMPSLLQCSVHLCTDLQCSVSVHDKRWPVCSPWKLP